MGSVHAQEFVGAKVVITDLNAESGENLANELGENVKFIKHDVTSETDWQNVIKETEEAFGPVNVLINNAGVAILEPLEGMTPKTYRKIIEINQTSAFLGMHYIIPSMKKAGGGSIINISSIAGLRGVENHIAYSASKFAMVGMTKVAALELAKYKIRANTIHPGAIKTAMVSENKDAEKIVAASVPLQRMGETKEVTNLVFFLASDESTYSTGGEFLVEGGILSGV